MPWSETDKVDQRKRFVRDYSRRYWSMTELCERYGVSRTTGYKWVERFEEEGRSGLVDRSRRPKSSVKSGLLSRNSWMPSSRPLSSRKCGMK